MLCYDIMSIIFNNLDIYNQIRFRQLTHNTYDEIQITAFCNSCFCTYKLTDSIIRMYPYITKLDAFNTDITNVNHLKYLRELDAHNIVT